MLRVMQNHAEPDKAMFPIRDNTDLAWFFGDGATEKELGARFHSITQNLVANIEGAAALVADSRRYMTERGVPHTVLYNGFAKLEGEQGVEVVLTDDFSADAQVEALQEIADRTLTAVMDLRADPAQRLVWRAMPAIGRALTAKGLAVSIRTRLAWD